MTTFAAAARALTLVTALTVLGAGAYLWVQSFTAKADFFGPGCAAEFSC